MPSEFRKRLLALVPSLRAFAFCLTRDQSEADDLVYKSLIEIWSKHRLKNSTELRIAAFTVVDSLYRAGMSARQLLPHPVERPPSAESEAFSVAFGFLSRNEREALSLVMVWAFTYEQAAKICGTDTHTLERRIANACFRLAPILPIRNPAASSGCSNF